MSKIKIITASLWSVLLFSIVGCTNHQGMMQHGNDTMYMSNWNWLLIAIGLVIVFLLGLAITRRKK